MNNSKNDQYWSCTAYASRYVYEDEGKMRSGIEFEAIKAEKVSAFLRRDREALKHTDDENFAFLLDHYLEHGTEGELFYEKKLEHFGDGEAIYYITVWFDVPAEAKQFELNSWYRIEKGISFACVLEPFIPVDVPEPSTCMISKIDQEDSRTLEKLFAIKNSEGIDSSADSDGGMLKTISAEARFWGAAFYYVGAALCVGLHSARLSKGLDIWVPNCIEGYFDFGFNDVERGNAHVRANFPYAAANLENIKEELRQRPAKVIIISHWHADHISIARHLFLPEYNPFWQWSRWYVPEESSPVPILIARKIRGSGACMTVLKNVFPADNTVYQIDKNPYLAYGKIDAFNPVNERGRPSKDGQHAHHHGIYAKIQLVDISGNFFRSLLLAGDCTYSGIPIAQKKVHYLQACHHGGEYALPPSTGDRKQHLPVPADKNGTVIYSANGSRHGHPNPAIMQEHAEKGWIAEYRTDYSVIDNGDRSHTEGRWSVTYGEVL
ncbi:hypothetical protein [Sediminispirochaeta bajacaliforniensis]|uniref:hypothetical protein n=1 Tax=Sediminispirochaeta bajacaliforniensis TaxID=148 RepID=UPI000361643F|nr:hypothetical protein [Sediminispirochaeta bajacaliforniensis]